MFRAEPDVGEKIIGASPTGFGIRKPLGGKRVGDDATNRPARVEGSQRVLVDHRDPAAPRASFGFGRLSPWLAGQVHAAFVWLDQGQSQTCRGGLARSGFSDYAERLAHA